MKKTKIRTKIVMLTTAALISTSWFAATPDKAEAATSYKVSPGVDYREVRVGGTQTANVLEVSLTDPHTQLGIHAPRPFRATKTTTEQARERTVDGYRVVGAVNATFFDMTSSERLPFSIIAEDDVVVNYGTVSTDPNFYRSEPIAFGVKKDGKATVDRYSIQSNASFRGQSLPIDNINYIRDANQMLLYTPMNTNGRTGTNAYGVEVIVRGATKDMKNLSFGDVVTGKVETVTRYGQGGNAQVPADGFVLSGHGAKNIEELGKLNPGDEVTVSVNINDTWKGAEFMLGSGPQLVKNGRVDITMNESNWRASQRVARTAVAADRSGDKVFMVTVERMNLREFAEYLVRIGADSALNFDGGGSTTMAVRRHGQEYATLANRPSDGAERRVSATLQAISTAPLSAPRSLRMESISPVSVGESITLKPRFALDEYYNVVPYSDSQLGFTVTNGVGEMSGKTFRATAAGEGRIQATINGQGVGSIPVTVRSTNQFTDVPAGYWAYHSLLFLKERNILRGYDNGTVRPAAFLTRTQAASMLVREFKLDHNQYPAPTFRDVPSDYYAMNEIRAISGSGFMRGNEHGRFDPNGQLTRGQMAAILVRAYNLSAPADRTGSFTDVSADHWAHGSIEALSYHGIAGGYEDGRFGPGDPVTRAQFAVFLERAIKKMN